MSTQRHTTYIGLAALVPAELNPKDHDLPTLVESLRRFGWTIPILLDERTGRMAAGHGRREAAIWMRAQGMQPPDGVYVDDDGDWVVPVSRGWASLNDTEALAYVVADNQTTRAGGWHMMMLAQALQGVATEDATLLDAIGFQAEDIDAILSRINPDSLDQGPLGWDDDSRLSIEPADPTARKVVLAHCPSCGTEFEAST